MTIRGERPTYALKTLTKLIFLFFYHSPMLVLYCTIWKHDYLVSYTVYYLVTGLATTALVGVDITQTIYRYVMQIVK